jgi:hypothetical protein
MVSENETTDNQEVNPAAAEWAVETEPVPTRLDTKNLDFDSITETFTKIADPNKAISPRIATEEEEVVTEFAREDGSTYIEATNTAYPGDAIMTGPKGEHYVLTEDNFAAMYEPLKDENGEPVDGKYLAKNIVKRIKNPTGQEIVIDAPWGGDQTGEADCWLVESQINGDRYIIEASAFDATYLPTEVEQ